MLEIGSMVKGKDLRNMVLCKVVTEDLNMKGFQYKLGLNEDTQPLVTKGSCRAGLHFAGIENICDFLDYGTKLTIVSVPDEEPVYVDNGKFRSHKLIIERVIDLGTIDTWQYLRENGVDVAAGANAAVRWAACHGHLDVVRYLHENGADITARGNEAVRYAAENGYLDIVKYLHKHGADITAQHNYAVRWAALNGHLDVVKYLYENGVDHQEVVDYLLANGAKLDN